LTIVPESNEPLSAATSCEDETVSLFTHVTVDPTGTVSGFGTKPPAPAVLAPFGMLTVNVDGDGDVGVELLDPPQPALTIASVNAMETRKRIMDLPPRRFPSQKQAACRQQQAGSARFVRPPAPNFERIFDPGKALSQLGSV
jgi:hypothetical protein